MPQLQVLCISGEDWQEIPLLLTADYLHLSIAFTMFLPCKLLPFISSQLSWIASHWMNAAFFLFFSQLKNEVAIVKGWLDEWMPVLHLRYYLWNICVMLSNFRSAATGKLRVVEDKLMQQKAQLLLDEAASWSLLWYLYGKGNSFDVGT